MSASPDTAGELGELLAALREDTITDAQAERLIALLRDDPNARRVYIHQMALVANLLDSLGDVHPSSFVPHPSESVGAAVERVGAAVELPHQLDAASPEALIPPIIIDSSPTIHYPLSTIGSSLGGWLLSYAVATVLTGAAILGAWFYKVSHDYAINGPWSPSMAVIQHEKQPEPKPQTVGRISALADCRWADTGPAPAGSAIPLGGKYALASGLMEIAYDSGAKVILQGPCTYEVDSAAGGFLSLGKLTARVERSEVRTQGSEHSPLTTSHYPLATTSNPQSLIPNPRFVVRTPTAVVTDLGTEFGVEVDALGATQSHVFRGKVELRAAGGGQDSDAQPIPLGENESARVEAGQDRAVRVIRLSAKEARPGGFTRQMPCRMPIKVFSTGQRVNEGDEDPHWQIIARTDDPHFEPRPAVVTAVGPTCMPNDVSRSQWISTANNLPWLPDNVTYTFRTTFELRDMLPGSAVLRGQFVVDDRVAAIRLNGQPVPMPEGQSGPHSEYRRFAAVKGFVEGANILEIDVYNGDPAHKDRPASAMALLVELEGSFVCAGHSPAAAEGNSAAVVPGRSRQEAGGTTKTAGGNK